MEAGGDAKNPPNPSNPFVHHIDLSLTQKLKIGILGLTLLPLRLLVALICLTLTTTLAYIGLYNLTLEEREIKPFTHWRLFLRKVICCILRFMFFVCGFHKLDIIGKQADPRDAKILAVAPHSTFFDALAVIVMGAPSVVAKAETSSIPFWGSLIKYTQPVLVHRNDPNSRQNTIQQIVERSSPSEDWQQVLIFPEGTCTNRSCLITFRPGAFLPGVPVQPVILRYNNLLDTVTWTWEGISVWKIIVYSLSQFTINASIEFMEPIIPNPKEVKDAKLFAGNVRSVMSKKMGIPTTDCNYFDYLRIEKSRRRGKCLQKLQRKLEHSLLQTTTYIDHLEEDRVCDEEQKEHLVSTIGARQSLAELSCVTEDLLAGGSGDLRHMRLAIIVAGSSDSLDCFLESSFRLFDTSLGDQEIQATTCLSLLQIHIFLSSKEAAEAVASMTTEDRIYKKDLETLISVTKPNYLKVMRAMEDQLTDRMTELLTKTAGLTAERMAARLEKVAASGSILVSDMSATVAAGRDKVTDALSSAVTSLHKRTDSYGKKKD